jgi:hypothetical protein
MRRRRDTQDEMADPRFRLDAGTADRLLAGLVAPDDAPPGYAEVAGMLQPLAADLPSRPAAAGEGTIRMMAKVVGISDPLKPRRRPHPLRGRIVALAMVGSLGTTGVAFAGGLPDAAQRVVSRWFEGIGVMIPHPREGAGTDPEHSAAELDAPGTEARAMSPARRGTMATQPNREDRGPRAAGDARAGGTNDGGDGVADDEATDASSAGSSPPVPAPNRGGTDTADDASGGISPTGTAVADERSVGRSSAGSANAAADSNADDALTTRAGAPPDPDAP